jgi:hypothetical protein
MSWSSFIRGLLGSSESHVTAQRPKPVSHSGAGVHCQSLNHNPVGSLKSFQRTLRLGVFCEKNLRRKLHYLVRELSHQPETPKESHQVAR